jgi:hypothetical protein
MTEIQAAIPAIVTAPLVMVVAVMFFTDFDQDSILFKVIFRVGESVITITDFTFFSYELNLMLDALVTLIVVKPYRLATIEIFKNMKRKFVFGKSSISAVADISLVKMERTKKIAAKI